MPYYISPPPQGPLTRIVAAIVTVIALAGAFMIGIAAFLVVGGIALVAGVTIWLRIAWLRRKMRKGGFNPEINMNAERNSAREHGHVIDAEYTVVSDSQDEKDQQSENRR